MKSRFLRTSAVIFLASSLAHAEPSAQDKAQADAFFREGRALMSDGKFAQACGKFSESQRLDPAPGTLVNLALCHEKEGKTASAWAEFNEVAERPGDDRARTPFARGRSQDLEKRLSRVRVRVDRPAPDEVVTIDGRPHGAVAWGSALPLDPGEHFIEAVAPGKKGWRLSVRLESGPSLIEVAVPMLDDAPAPLVSPAPETHPTAPMAPQERGSAKTAGFIVGAVGIAAIGVGSYFGLRTLGKKSDADDLCPTNRCAGDPRITELDDSARSSALVSTIAFGAGIAALAAGALLVLTAPGVAIAPSASPRAGGASLIGRF